MGEIVVRNFLVYFKVQGLGNLKATLFAEKKECCAIQQSVIFTQDHREWI